MLDQIAQLEKDNQSQDSLGFANIGGKAMSRAPGGAATDGAGASAEDVIANVEKMLAQEKEQSKATAKGGKKLVSLDLNEGIVGTLGKTGEEEEGDLDEDIEKI